MVGRRILVTGAASGIGAALVRRIHDAGDIPVGIDRREAVGIIGCDLTDVQAVAATAKTIGELDGIAHVAGLPGTHRPADIVQVNFLAIRQITEALFGSLNDHAAIVSVSSITARRCTIGDGELIALVTGSDRATQERASAMDGEAAYAFSKKLLNCWTALFAADNINAGIRANAIAPGPIDTPILEDFRVSMGSDRIAAAERMTGRHGAADEVAAVAAFLLSPAASWVNGVVIPIDGGFGAARDVAGLSASRSTKEFA